MIGFFGGVGGPVVGLSLLGDLSLRAERAHRVRSVMRQHRLFQGALCPTISKLKLSLRVMRVGLFFADYFRKKTFVIFLNEAYLSQHGLAIELAVLFGNLLRVAVYVDLAWYTLLLEV